jgi:hypothetical protein
LIAVRSLPTNTTEARGFNRSNFAAIFYTDSMGRSQEGKRNSEIDEVNIKSSGYNSTVSFYVLASEADKT